MDDYSKNLVEYLKENLDGGYKIIISAKMEKGKNPRHLFRVHFNDYSFVFENFSLTGIIVRNSHEKDFILMGKEFEEYKMEGNKKELIQRINNFFSN